MGLKDLLDRIKLTFCCKSKCSLNEVAEKIDDVNEWIDELEELQDNIVETKEKNNQYNYYSKKKHTI